MFDEDERLYAARVIEAGSDVVALRALGDELGSRQEGWARVACLRVVKKLADLKTHSARVRSAGDFWTRYDLTEPDGRALYAYRLSDAAFVRLEGEIRGLVGSGRLEHGLGPALFVLWASEWFRRVYRGGGERWNALVKACGGRFDQAQLRDLTARGLRDWRREVKVAAGGRQFLSTLAREGGFPVAAVEHGGRGWARDVLHAVLAPLLGEGRRDFDRAVELVREQGDRLPQSFHDEEFFALCADLALAIVVLRQEAEEPAAAAGIPIAAWLTLHRPNWRETLPITAGGGAAAALVERLMSIEAEPAWRGAARAERLLVRGEASWHEALRLYLDGPLAADALAGLDPAVGRLRAHAAGALARTLPGELALIEPPALGETHWTSRAISRSRGITAVPFGTGVELDLRSGERSVARIAISGGAVRRGQLLVLGVEEETGGTPRLLKVEASGSGLFQAAQVVIQVPADWHVDPLAEAHLAPLGAGVGGARLWRVAGGACAVSPEGDRYVVRTGQTADRRDRIELLGDRPHWACVAGEIDLFRGPPVVRLSDSRRGAIYLRRIGSREWRRAPSPLPIGHYEIGWREERLLLDRRRVAVISAAARLESWGWGGGARYRPDGFGTCRLVPAADAPVTVGGDRDDEWRARPVARPVHRFDAELRWPDSAADPPLAIALDFPAEASITRWDGTALPGGARLTLAGLRDLVAVDRDQVRLFGELILPGSRQAAETMSWTVNREMAMSVAAPDIASMLLPAHIDAAVRLGMHDGIETYWHVAQFGPALAIDRDGVVTGGAAESGAEVCGRPFADPAREIVFGRYPPAEDAGAVPIVLPSSLAGLWLVYLRRGGEVLTRPAYHRGKSGALPPSGALGRAMVLSPGHGLDEALTELLDAASGDQVEAAALIEALNEVVASLTGLPPRTLRVLELAGERPNVLARMAMLATDAQRDPVAALADALPFAWCLVPAAAWQDAQHLKWTQGRAQLAALGDDAARYAKQMVDHNVAMLVAREPLLEPVLAPGPTAADLPAITQAFLNRAHHRVGDTTGSRFRRSLGDRLPRYFERFDARFLETLDAPCAAALAVGGAWRPDLADVRRIKAIARTFPNFFADAFAASLQEPA